MKNRRPVTLKMHIIARLARGHFDHKARGIGLTSAQWRTIVTVRNNEGATQRRVATILEVREVTAGRMIDRLIEEGLIERRRDEEDRRAYRLYLTPAATPVLAKLEILGAEEEKRALAGLSGADLARLDELLDRVVANLGGVGQINDAKPPTTDLREYDDRVEPD